MPRKCSICLHPDREKIEELLVEGKALREIAGQFSLNKSSLDRHKLAHLPELLSKAGEAKEKLRGDTILKEIERLREKAEQLTQRAEDEGDLRAALAGIRELVRIVELQSKLIGDLQDHPTVNLLVNPQWISIRSAILDALEPHPEIKLRLAEVLKDVC